VHYTWQSYKQERDCLVHILPLLAVLCRPGALIKLITHFDDRYASQTAN